MNIFGHNFRLAIWGESHGPQIGISIDGVPAGIPLSAEDFEADLARRRSGARGTTPRREPDIPQIVSGLYNGMTTGAPLTIEFANTDTHSQDYATVARHYRPSHADLVAYHRFNGFNDPRGGGHFSARLTVAFVAAGVVAKKMLPPGIAFDTRITEIGGCTDPARFDEVLRAAAADRDSVGGIIECRVQGVPLGLGQPFFDSAESLIALPVVRRPGRQGGRIRQRLRRARACAARREQRPAARTAKAPPRPTAPAASTAASPTATRSWSARRSSPPRASAANKMTYNQATGPGRAAREILAAATTPASPCAGPWSSRPPWPSPWPTSSGTDDPPPTPPPHTPRSRWTRQTATAARPRRRHRESTARRGLRDNRRSPSRGTLRRPRGTAHRRPPRRRRSFHSALC